jgi:hypothetical protein
VRLESPAASRLLSRISPDTVGSGYLGDGAREPL